VAIQIQTITGTNYKTERIKYGRAFATEVVLILHSMTNGHTQDDFGIFASHAANHATRFFLHLGFMECF